MIVSIIIPKESAMNLSNITVNRIVTHEVVRAATIEDYPPSYSSKLMNIDERAKGLLAKRMTAAIGSGSHCVPVTVDDSTVGSPFDFSTRLLRCDDINFVNHSRHLAEMLSAAQLAGSIKAGTAIFVEGTCVLDDFQKHYIAIIKADSDQGLDKSKDGDIISLHYLSEIILGESQRLIKIAILFENRQPTNNALPVRDSDDFTINVFDHMLQNGGDRPASLYFYKTFLRCSLADDSPRKTKHFFETAISFINNLKLPSTDKADLRVDLISYMRGNRSTIEPRTFAIEVLPEPVQDCFVRNCRDVGIIDAIAKDNSLLKGKLKKHTVKFSSNVTIVAPSEIFKHCVHITGSTDGWTNIQIMGDVEA